MYFCTNELVFLLCFSIYLFVLFVDHSMVKMENIVQPVEISNAELSLVHPEEYLDSLNVSLYKLN